MATPNTFELAQAMRVLTDAGIAEPTKEQAGLAFVTTILKQRHDAKLVAEAIRRMLEISGTRPTETAFTMVTYQYGHQELEHFELIRETIIETIRPGIVARQRTWQHERAERDQQKQTMAKLFDELLLETGDTNYDEDMKLKADVETSVQAARSATRPPRQQRGRT